MTIITQLNKQNNVLMHTHVSRNDANNDLNAILFAKFSKLLHNE